MRISAAIADRLWWGIFLDQDRSCLYFAPVPWILLTVAWGPQYDYGHMQNTGLTARRDRISGDIDVLLYDRADTWKPHISFWGDRYFRPGSPQPTEQLRHQ